MSSNIYNINVPVPQDPNTYHINDIKIQFLKDYKKEYNEVLTSKSYQYAPLLNTSGIYQVVEFNYKDSNGYIKLKDKDMWLYEIDDNLFFDQIKQGLYSVKQPLPIWFQYPREREFIVYKLLGYSVEAVVKKEYDYQYNIAYLHYKEINGKIFMKWTKNVNDATKFHFDTIKWADVSWFKLQDKERQRELLSGNKQYISKLE